jgi:UDP-2,3-diacylglucosamine pyrophosphatase LpxH
MLGNHDVELCLPGVRQTFLDTLGEGRVEFLYDNEAFTLGPVLIEHGNRYDEWNAVRYGALRRVRSQLSRGIVAKEFPTPPGSQLVAEVMNRLKAEYSFIDLLKPEDAGVMPILAALGAGSLRDVWRFFGKYRQTREVEFDDDRQPMDETYIGGPHDPDQEMFNLAEAIAAGGDATQVSAFSDALHGTRATVSAAVREYRRRALLKALRALVTHHRLTFEVDHENPLYLAGAKASAGRGYKVVVYGHTHLVKRISLNGIAGATLPVYVNTGTWSDLIRIPDDVCGEQGAARLALDEFVADLESDHIGRWRRFVPTFARIEVDGDAIRSADVYFADGGADERVTTEGLRRRLSREVSRE